MVINLVFRFLDASFWGDLFVSRFHMTSPNTFQVLRTQPQLPPPPQRSLPCQPSPSTPSNRSNPLPPSPCTIRRHGGIARLCNNLLRPQLNPPTSNLQRPHLSPPTNNQSLRNHLQRPRLILPTISPLSPQLRLRLTRSRKLVLHTTTES